MLKDQTQKKTRTLLFPELVEFPAFRLLPQVTEE